MSQQTVSRHPNLAEPTRTLLLTGDNEQQKRQELLRYFIQTWEQYESLFNCLNDSRAWFSKAISLRHPLIFYFGHTAAFYVNKLLASQHHSQRNDDRLDSMVAIGAGELSGAEPHDRLYAWPTVDETRKQC